MLLLQLRGTDCAWLHRLSEGAQQLRVNAIGLGQNTLALGQIAALGWPGPN